MPHLLGRMDVRSQCKWRVYAWQLSWNETQPKPEARLFPAVYQTVDSNVSPTGSLGDLGFGLETWRIVDRWKYGNPH